MEQAVNTFSKGLLMDTHPMVLGNDTLSNVLNGTFITMNGNEVILQNDMGNRRVDNAFLPAGYVPVGMKEYGGIIYVASYNPLNGRSLIGSFPSPERNFSDLLDDSKENSVDNIDISKFTTKDEDIINDTVISLVSDKNLYPGDKFIVYGDLGVGLSISNKNNIDENTGRVNSPKNGCFTFSLGILNSLNQFVDITPSLARWKDDSTTPVEFKDGVSDLIKFNTEYFIPKSIEEDDNETIETISDNKLTKEREYQTLAVNTYSHKLVGPLYLQAKLNHILEFNYNIYGTATGETTAEVYIEGFLTYNCPDGFSEGEGDDNYVSYLDKKWTENNNNKFFIIKDKDKDEGNVKIISASTKYNPETNLYYAKIVLNYILSANNDTIYKGTLKVFTNAELENYVKGLESEIEIDFSKLGSGELELKGYRFYNDVSNKQTKITLVIEAYPKYGESFKNLKLEFYKYVEDDKSKTISPAEESSFTIELNDIYNGRTTLTFNWDDYGIKEGDLYEVRFDYSIIGQDGKEKSNTESTKPIRWFLATALMNNSYTQSGGLFIADYGKPKGKEKTSSTETVSEKAILEKLFIVPIGINLNYTDYSQKPIYSNSTLEGEGLDSWVSRDKGKNGELHIKYEHKYNIDIKIDPNLEILYLKLYPNLLKINENDSITYTKTATLLMDDIEIDLYSKNGNYKIEEEEKFYTLQTKEKESTETKEEDTENNTSKETSTETKEEGTKLNISNINVITETINFYDIFKGATGDKILKNPFVLVDDKDFGIINSFKFEKGMILYTDYANSEKKHKFNQIFRDGFISSELEFYKGTLPGKDDESGTYGYYIDEKKSSGFIDFNYYDHKGDINSNLNSELKNSIFTFMFLDNKNDSENFLQYKSYNKDPLNNDRKSSQYARVWWRCNQDSDWALFNDLFKTENKTSGYDDTKGLEFETVKSEFNTFILHHIFQNLPTLYCFCNELYSDTAGLKVPSSINGNYNYNRPYTLTGNIEVRYEITNNSSSDNTTAAIINSIEVNLNEDNDKEEFTIGGNIENTIKIPFNIPSNEKFQDYINKFVTSETIDNIYIDNGLSVDNLNNTLSPRLLYLYNPVTNTALKSNLKNIVITSSYGATSTDNNPDNNNIFTYNTILYSGNNIGSPFYKYDIVGGAASSIVYDKVNIVNT